ncbi:hypothetical protein TRFO_18996 [Tritrichomonas foetus]|uniref:Uncharacterized protein n=1 Tax=Tritrichomonas foetus TaxID=1144522 RepID=A0A1J4KJQ8_9EUKA|nr:hypothetical protein TRFO_18996 [Tritrichomonas foetus]|eukprot:OHT11543.1 hypothetical protein TRFO_18996 [Tritrichomonas foetus]
MEYKIFFDWECFFRQKKIQKFLKYIQYNLIKSLMDDIKNDTESTIKKTIEVLHALTQKPIPLLPIIHEMDYSITKYNSLFNNKSTNNDLLQSTINRRVTSFKLQRMPQILLFFNNFFHAINSKLDDLTTKIVDIKIRFSRIVDSNENEMHDELQKYVKDGDKAIENKEKENKQNIMELCNQVENNINELKIKLESEENRVNIHYNKILDSKLENIVMTENAIQRSKGEQEEIVMRNNEEMNSLHYRNNESLKIYTDKVYSSIMRDEEKVRELENKVEILAQDYKKIAPEMKVEERRKELNKRFEQSDHEFHTKNDSLLKEIEILSRQIIEHESILKDLIWEQKNSVFTNLENKENELKNMIEERKSFILKAEKEKIDFYKKKIKRLKDNLKQMNSNMVLDADNMKLRMNDKQNIHKERTEKLESDQKLFIKKYQEDTEEINDKIKETKKEWEQERDDVIKEYQSELNEVDGKLEKEEKYFVAKCEAIRNELTNIINENKNAMKRDVNENNNDNEKENYDIIDGYVGVEEKYKASEKELGKKLNMTLKNISDNTIQKKLLDLKNKHKKEREKLLQEISTSKVDENQLLKEENDIQKGVIPSASGSRIQSSFQTERFIDAKIDKWREDYLVDCKHLKKEEATTLKSLEKTKIEFGIAVKKTMELKRKIAESTEFYVKASEQINSTNTEEIQELRHTLIEKEKEIAFLEKQYEENERELRRHTRQIEQSEDKIASLRTRLAEEKVKIKVKIKDEYQPQIFQERRRKEVMINEIEKFRNELELQIEYIQHEIYMVETSNAAMEEELRKETEELVQNMKIPIHEELQNTEIQSQDEFDRIELELLSKVNDDQNNFIIEEKRLREQYEERIFLFQEEQKHNIMVINDYCMVKISENSIKKKKIDELENIKCERCPTFDINIKKLEKRMIDMQETWKSLELNNNHKIETVKRFRSTVGGRTILPKL